MLKVLIADDERWMRKSMCEDIDWGRAGMELMGAAEDGAKALEMIRELKPDIVFTDIQMPGVDGIGLLRQAREWGLATEFIFLSGYDRFEYAKEAVNLGAAGYLLKPFEPEELLEILSRTKDRAMRKKCEKYYLPDDVEADTLKELDFYDNLILRVKKYIAEHYQEEINLESMAREFRFSPNYLSRIFKNRTQTGIMEYLTDYRIEIAKKYLLNIRFSISDVAAMVGYKNNPKYFTRVFKKSEGLTPGEYIRKKANQSTTKDNKKSTGCHE